MKQYSRSVWLACAIVPAFVTSALVLFTCKPGLDLKSYMMGGSALTALDPSVITGNTISPAGFPVSHWMHGVGFIYRLPAFLTFNFISPEASWRIVAAVLFLLFFSLAFKGALKLYRPNFALAVFVLGAV